MTDRPLTKQSCWIVDLSTPMHKLRNYIYQEIVPHVVSHWTGDKLYSSVDRLAASMAIYSAVLEVNSIMKPNKMFPGNEMTLHPSGLIQEDFPLLSAAAVPKLAEGLAIHSEIAVLEEIYAMIPLLGEEDEIKITKFQAILGDTPSLMIMGDERVGSVT